MDTPTLTPEQARIVEIGRALVKSGTDPRDAVTIARFTQAVFPDTPLEKLNIFADPAPRSGSDAPAWDDDGCTCGPDARVRCPSCDAALDRMGLEVNP